MRQDILTFSVGHLVRMIDDGLIGLPNFQRDFVWPPSQIAALLDSVARDWPIGTLLLVPPVPELAMRPIKGAPSLRRDGVRYLVLDGQQRLTALYQAINGVGDYGFSLSHSRRMEKDQLFDWDLPPVSGLMAASSDLDRLYSYNLPCVVLADELEVYELAQIFEAINTPGMPIDVFDLANARAGAIGEDLREGWGELRDKLPILSEFRVSPLDILRLVALNFARHDRTVRSLRASDLLDIPSGHIASAWPSAIEDYAKGLALLVEGAGVVGSADLPSSRAALVAASQLPAMGRRAALAEYWHCVLRPSDLTDSDLLNAVRGDASLDTTESTRFTNGSLRHLSRGANGPLTRAFRGLARITGALDPFDGNELAHREIKEFEYEPGRGITGPVTPLTELAKVVYVSTANALDVRLRLRDGSVMPERILRPEALSSQGFTWARDNRSGRHETLLGWIRSAVSEIV